MMLFFQVKFEIYNEGNAGFEVDDGYYEGGEHRGMYTNIHPSIESTPRYKVYLYIILYTRFYRLYKNDNIRESKAQKQFRNNNYIIKNLLTLLDLKKGDALLLHLNKSF